MATSDNGIRRRVEVVINVCLVLLALGLTAVVAKRVIARYTGSDVKGFPDGYHEVKRGTTLSASGIDLGLKPNTIILALRKGCPYCTQSASFYKRLQKDPDIQRDFQIVALLPGSPGENQEYLSQIGMTGFQTKQLELMKIGVNLTPTVIWVDRQGSVRGLWKGMLSPEKENQVLGQLKGLSNAGTAKSPNSDLSADIQTIDPAGTNRLITEGQTQILDIDEREQFAIEHIPGSKNILLDELGQRAGHELSKSANVVIYNHLGDDAMSGTAYNILIKLGFTKVKVLSGGLDAWKEVGLSVTRN